MKNPKSHAKPNLIHNQTCDRRFRNPQQPVPPFVHRIIALISIFFQSRLIHLQSFTISRLNLRTFESTYLPQSFPSTAQKTLPPCRGSSVPAVSQRLQTSGSPQVHSITYKTPQVLQRRPPNLPRPLPRSQKYDYPDVLRLISKTDANQTLIQPCCVCKTEKTARDDCMLFSKSDDPQQECKSMIEQYKACMAGYGFKV